MTVRGILIAILYLCALIATAQSQPPAALRPIQQLIVKRQFQAAEPQLREYVDQNPDDGYGWYFLGYTLHAQSKLDQALLVHQKAAEFAPVKASALYNAACVYSRKKDTDAAIKTLQMAVAAGLKSWANLSRDPELAHARKDPRFRALYPKLLHGAATFHEPVNVLHEFEGETANDQFGWIARRVGDIDKDGADDFVATAPTAGRQAGKIYVYSSKSGKLLFTRSGTVGSLLGNGAAGAGDVNADGIPDLIIGAPGTSTAEVLSGSDGKVLWTLKPPRIAASFGYKVAGGVDVDADGHTDVIVTALELSRTPGQSSGAGACFVYSGQSGKLLYDIRGERSADQFGSAAAAVQDGKRSMLAIGAQDAGLGKPGRVYVFNLGADSARQLFTIDGDGNSKDLGKMFVDFPGDFDRDGIVDVYASDFADSTTASGAGRIRVVSGRDGKLLLSASGTQQGEGFGTSPSGVGDVNGDMIPDLAVGAWQNSDQAASGGKVTVISGVDGTVLRTFTCKQAGDTFGFDSVGLGDTNGDGFADYLCTSAWSPLLGPRTGRVFILSGASLQTGDGAED